jgi:hypothetical protein
MGWDGRVTVKPSQVVVTHDYVASVPSNESVDGLGVGSSDRRTVVASEVCVGALVEPAVRGSWFVRWFPLFRRMCCVRTVAMERTRTSRMIYQRSPVASVSCACVSLRGWVRGLGGVVENK